MGTRLLIFLTGITLFFSPLASLGQAAPSLGAAARFSLFTAVGAFNNVGPTVIQGDIGTNAGAFSGFPPGVVTGAIHVADTRATQAATDVQAAFDYLSTVSCVVPLAVYGGPVSNPQVLTPNSYCVNQATTLAGSLILDGQGNPNALFFLRVTGALTTDEGSTVTLINGASLSNVYWQITGRTDLGRNSVFRGTLITDGAINLVQGATLLGRGLSRAGAITLDTNTANVPTVTPTSTFWLGSRTTDWFTDTNWSDGVPTSLLDAVVPTGTSPFPLIASGSAAAKSLTIGNNASLTQRGGLLDVKEAIANSGSISATGGTVRLSGTTTQTVGGSGSTQFWGLTLTNATGASQTGAMSIHAALALTNGNLTTNGRPLTLLSDATGTALVVNTGGTVNGAATVQRYIDPSLNGGQGYRHYSSPVIGSTLSDLATSGFAPEFNQAYNTQGNTVTPFPNVFAYDQTRVTNSTNTTLAFDQGFLVPAGTDPMGVLSGYTVNIAANQVVDLQGTLTNGLVSRTNLTRGVQPQSGWQLLGNPYPSPIDFSQTAGVTRVNLDDAVYVYQSTGQYSGQYRSYVNGVGNPLVASMQGFFSRVSAGQTTGSLALNNSVRVTTFATTPAFNRRGAETRPLVTLRLQGSSSLLADETSVYFQQGASAAFDSHYDAFKLPNTSGLSLSTIGAGDELAVNGLAPLTTPTTVALNLGVPTVGTYTLSAASLLNFAPGAQVLLLDTQTGARINLTQQPSYTFQAGSTTLPGRFSLSFAMAGPLANRGGNLAELVQVFPNPAHSRLTLVLPTELGRTAVAVALFNALGQQVLQRTVAMTAAGATDQLDVSMLASGVYSLRVVSTSGQVVKRVVVE